MDRLDWFILGDLLRVALRDPIDGVLWPDELEGHPFPVDAVYSSLRKLEESDLIASKLIGPDNEDDKHSEVFAIAPKGISLVLSSAEEIVGSFRGLTWDFPDDVEKAYSDLFDGGLLVDEIPASDRVVTLSHNQSEYQEAVAALDRVIGEFRKDHRLDNELGHEKGALLKALEGGRDLLNDSEVNVRIGTALIVEPLRRLVHKYDQALVGAVASAALALILKLFGLG